MHEASLVMGMLPILEENLRKHNGKEITKITVKIGRLAGVEIEIFRFAYESIKGEYSWLKNSELVIEEVPIVYKCNDCGTEFIGESSHFEPCPKCGSFAVEMIKGEELFVEKIEIEK